MAWNELIDQERVVQALKSAITRDRVAHAYLFYGPDGVGKRAVAIEFARTLECERGGEEACGTCTPCSKVRRMIHPDVQILLPQPSDAETTEIVDRLQRLAANPYSAVDFIRRPSFSDPAKKSNKQAFYSVERINDELRRTISYKPVEGRYKVVVVTDADLMRKEASNAFLKLLEEPPPQTVFILTTGRPDRLLPTILSRCQRLRFDTLPVEEIERSLIEKEQVEPQRAGTLARMADGSYSRALDLLESEDLMANREMVVEFLRMSYVHHTDRLPDILETLSAMSRERLKGMLALTLSWVRDLVLYQTMGPEASLVNIDQLDAVRKFCEKLPDADLNAMIGLIENAIDLVERNVHLFLVVRTLSQSLHAAMRGPHSGRLYIPLTDPVP